MNRREQPMNKKDIDILTTKWYHKLCLNLSQFNQLGLDERGQLVNSIIEYMIKNNLEKTVDNDMTNADIIKILEKCTGYIS